MDDSGHSPSCDTCGLLLTWRDTVTCMRCGRITCQNHLHIHCDDCGGMTYHFAFCPKYQAKIEERTKPVPVPKPNPREVCRECYGTMDRHWESCRLFGSKEEKATKPVTKESRIVEDPFLTTLRDMQVTQNKIADVMTRLAEEQVSIRNSLTEMRSMVETKFDLLEQKSNKSSEEMNLQLNGPVCNACGIHMTPSYGVACRCGLVTCPKHVHQDCARCGMHNDHDRSCSDHPRFNSFKAGRDELASQ